MANLAPYYVHSNYDLFQGGPTSGYSVNRIFGRSKVKNFVALMRQEIVMNQQRLGALEDAFYEKLGLKNRGDAGFYEMLAMINKNAEENKNSQDKNRKEIYLFSMLRKNVISHISTFISELSNRIVKEFGNKSIVPGEILKEQMADLLQEYAIKLFPEEKQSVINNTITRFVRNTKINVKMTNTEFLTSSNRKVKIGARSNIQGDFGEIAEGLAELVLNQEIGNMTVTNTGSLVYKGSSGNKQFTSDLVFEFTIEGPNGTQPYQVGWQIKAFNLSNSSYDTRIPISNFEVKNKGWEELGDELGREGLYEDSEQFDALTYALVNAAWFNQGGDYKIGPNKTFSLSQIAINEGKGVIATVKQLRQILGMLTTRTMTKNLSDIITNEGRVIGIVQLTKADGSIDKTVKQMNIPAVFWVMNGNNFFPSRWVLRDLIKWVDFNFKQQVFTPTSEVTVEYKGSKLPSPAKFWFSKRAAVKEPLRRPPLYNNAIRKVGNELGEEIASNLHINADMAIIRNQIKNLSSMLGLK